MSDNEEIWRSYTTALTQLRKRHATEVNQMRGRYWHRLKHRAPAGVTENNWFQPPPTKRPKRGHVRRWRIAGNQFTTFGGGVACTTISFIAICRMSRKSTAVKIRTEIRWKDVLRRGAKLWNDLLGPDRSLDGQRFLSLHDMKELPQLQHLPEMLKILGQAKERTGSLDNAVNTHMNEGNNKAMYHLGESLAKMHKMAPSVGTLTIGASTVSLWHHGQEWCLYDSHRGSSPGSSLLVTVEGASGVREIEEVIRERYRSASSQKLDFMIEGRSRTVFYSISLLPAEAVAGCKKD